MPFKLNTAMITVGVSSLLILSHPRITGSGEILRSKLQSLTHGFKGTIGIAIKNLETGDTLSINGHSHSVLQSVIKFPAALAVLHKIDKHELSLSQMIYFSKQDLVLPNSPLKDQYPKGGVSVPISELLYKMICQSDNNACDKLIKVSGGPGSLQNYIHALGVSGIALKTNEAGMAKAWENQYLNWAEPLAVLKLIDLSYVHSTLLPASKRFLWQCMEQTTTGRHRLKGLLPLNTYVAHKTGTSGTNLAGLSPGPTI